MRKVFLDELPKDKKGRIKWKESVGRKFGFIYDDIEGIIKIIDYKSNGQVLTIDYNKNLYSICTSNLIKCKLGGILNKYTNNFKVGIGDKFKDSGRNLSIIDREYRIRKSNSGYFKYYKYICDKCGWTEGWIEESNLLKGIGCGCCSGNNTVLGINTIWDTDRWMCDLGVSEEDAKKYSKGSEHKVKCVCPRCGNIMHKPCSRVYGSKTISCNCSDGFSYPEKFMYSALKQLGVDFQTQLSKTTFEWCDKYKYDFYIASLNCIIETHGGQHYKESNGNRKSLKEEQENDNIKRGLAKKNGIHNYIELDCRKSDLEWIRSNILNGKLNELLELSQVDWLKCEEFALNNLVKDVCDYWNNKDELETTSDLTRIFNMNRGTIIKYLKQGVKLNWCNYSPKYEDIKSKKRNSKLKHSCKPIVIFKDGVLLGEFESVKQLEINSENMFGIKLLSGGISSASLGISNHYKGFTFQYI